MFNLLSIIRAFVLNLLADIAADKFVDRGKKKK